MNVAITMLSLAITKAQCVLSSSSSRSTGQGSVGWFCRRPIRFLFVSPTCCLPGTAVLVGATAHRFGQRHPGSGRYCVCNRSHCLSQLVCSCTSDNTGCASHISIIGSLSLVTTSRFGNLDRRNARTQGASSNCMQCVSIHQIHHGDSLVLSFISRITCRCRRPQSNLHCVQQP